MSYPQGPEYPQGQYQQPVPGYQGWYPPPPRRTNVMAIVAIVMVTVFPPLAIVFGLIAKSQIKQRGEDGSGLALGAIIGGSALTAFVGLYIALIVISVSAGY